MRVLVISPEAGTWPHPSILADSVNGSIKAYSELGAEVRVYSPCYSTEPPDPSVPPDIYQGQESVRGEGYGIANAPGSPFFLVRHSGYFSRSGQYNDPDKIPYWDNHYRFSLLVSAALQHCEVSGFKPHFIHCHEWGAALAGAYARYVYRESFGKVPVILTIHNIEYDFHFLEQDIERIGLDWKDFNLDGFEFWGKVSLLKAGILYADQVVFASEGYHQQVLDRNLAGGIRGFLERHQHKLVGLQHGINYDRWTPFSSLPASLKEKSLAKAAFQQTKKLDVAETFVVYCHLDRETIRTAETLFTILTDLFHLPLQLIVGHSPTYHDQEYFRALADQNPSRMSVVVIRDAEVELKEALTAADVLFLSSTDEPSASLILRAMACGAIPVTGKDTGCASLLSPFNGENAQDANAVLVEEPWPDQMLRSLRTALDLYTSGREDWNLMTANAMKFRYTWKKTAMAYLALNS
jgi:starch synthase